LIYFVIISWLWILVSSARGGGDASDNPRYRVIFLLFMVLPSAWGYYWAKEIQNPWIVRIIAMEVIFLAAFTIWYAARYLQVITVPPILGVIGFTVGGCLIITLFGLWQDRHKPIIKEINT
jgi:hypothetical protein